MGAPTGIPLQHDLNEPHASEAEQEASSEKGVGTPRKSSDFDGTVLESGQEPNNPDTGTKEQLKPYADEEEGDEDEGEGEDEQSDEEQLKNVKTEEADDEPKTEDPTAAEV